MARVVLLEGWYRGSHRAWADQVRDHSRHRVELVTLPGVHWKWRMQGGPVALAQAVPAAIDRLGGIDALVATSAIDLAAFLGLARRHVGQVPTLLYLHENQITFPVRAGEAPDHTYGMATWRSMVAADRIVCNSAFHRDELFAAVPAFLRQFPDHTSAAVVADCRSRTTVIPPGVDVAAFRGSRPRTEVPLVLWNHRWEPDKAPERFVDAMHRLAAGDRRFDLAIAGSHVPGDRIRPDLGVLVDRVVHLGSASAETYPDLLRSCAVVVSTARHEFYGLAVAEAAAAGAIPVVPDRLAYPEVFPADLHPDLLYRDDRELDRLLARAVDDGDRRDRLSRRVREAAQAWDLAPAIGAIDDEIDALVTGGTRAGV